VAAGDNQLTISLIHADPGPDSFLLSTAGAEDDALIDWATPLRGPLLYDLASFAVLTRPAGPDAARWFTEGYAREVPEIGPQLAHLGCLVQARWVAHAIYFASRIERGIGRGPGAPMYATDEAMAEHGGRITPHDAPFLSEFKAMSMDERWVNRSPQAMLETFHWFRGEGFGLIAEDLRRLPAEPRVIAEGFRLLPRLVKPLLTTPDHAVWLLPTPAAGGCELRTRGRVVRLTSPRLYHDESRRDIRTLERQVLRMIGAADFLSLKTASAPGRGGAPL
jgi:hypothetical protein